MFGNNIKRKPFKSGGTILQVQEIFPSFQGEGVFVGEPCVFVRLGGCNLACDFCDTEFESFNELALADIISEVEQLSVNVDLVRVRKLVIISGGEPFRQPIGKLCQELLNLGFKVQIETNGTLWQDIPENIHIVCSPKVVNNKHLIPHTNILSRATCLKFLISAHQQAYNNVPAEYANYNIYVQPMDEYDEIKNNKNIELTKQIAYDNGYKISVQLHKILNIR